MFGFYRFRECLNFDVLNFLLLMMNFIFCLIFFLLFEINIIILCFLRFLMVDLCGLILGLVIIEENMILVKCFD